jgi:hypothetical protein
MGGVKSIFPYSYPIQKRGHWTAVQTFLFSLPRMQQTNNDHQQSPIINFVLNEARKYKFPFLLHFINREKLIN